MKNKLLIFLAIIASSHGFVGNIGFMMRQKSPRKMVTFAALEITFHNSYFLFQESVNLIDKISEIFTDLFFNPVSEEGTEKLDELEVEVKGSQLPPELRKLMEFRLFKIRMFMDFTKSKKENPAFAHPIFSPFGGK